METKDIIEILVENERFECGMLLGPKTETSLGNEWTGCIWIETCPCDCQSKILIIGDSQDRQVISMACNNVLVHTQLKDMIPYIKLNADKRPKIVRIDAFGFKKLFIQQKVWFKM